MKPQNQIPYCISVPVVLLFLMGAGVSELIVIMSIFFIPVFFFFRKLYRRRPATQKNAVVLSLITSLLVSPIVAIAFFLAIFAGFSIFS